ncbi:EamA/RhaT family transporter, partial [Streptomyces sp. NPDC059538]
MSAPTTPGPALPASVPSTPATATAAPVTAVAAAAPIRARRGGLLDWRVRFAILSVVWGFSFLLIKVGTEAYAPFQVALGRVLFGALALLPGPLVRREPRPPGRRPRGPH